MSCSTGASFLSRRSRFSFLLLFLRHCGEARCSAETPSTASTQHFKQEVRTLSRESPKARLPLDAQPEKPVSVYRKMGLGVDCCAVKFLKQTCGRADGILNYPQFSLPQTTLGNSPPKSGLIKNRPFVSVSKLSFQISEMLKFYFSFGFVEECCAGREETKNEKTVFTVTFCGNIIVSVE